MAFILGSSHRPVTESPTLTQSQPGVFSSGFVYRVQQSDLTIEQQEALFKKELSTCDFKKESCVSLFHRLLAFSFEAFQIDVQYLSWHLIRSPEEYMLSKKN